MSEWKKILELKRQKEKTLEIKPTILQESIEKITTPKTKKIKPKPQEEKIIELPEIENVTMDDLRGIKHFALGGTGSKLGTKVTISRELKIKLLNPKVFANFLKNLTKYLESI